MEVELSTPIISQVVVIFFDRIFKFSLRYLLLLAFRPLKKYLLDQVHHFLCLCLYSTLMKLISSNKLLMHICGIGILN